MLPAFTGIMPWELILKAACAISSDVLQESSLLCAGLYLLCASRAAPCLPCHPSVEEAGCSVLPLLFLILLGMTADV